MDIPTWIRIVVLILCLLAVFVLAARELVLQWLGNIAKAALGAGLFKLKGIAKRPSKDKIPLRKPGEPFPGAYWQFGL